MDCWVYPSFSKEQKKILWQILWLCSPSSLTTPYAFLYIKPSWSVTARLEILQICSNLVPQPDCWIIAEAPFVLAGQSALFKPRPLTPRQPLWGSHAMKVITNSTLCTLTKQQKCPRERKESLCLTYLIPTVCGSNHTHSLWKPRKW